jgi:aryl-alcohol dehydrogenase-like predicted oxidoreductase
LDTGLAGKVQDVMETTTLGRGGPVVSRAGLGLMGMSGIYGQADDHESLATISAAVDAGITLLDSSGTGFS